MFTTGRIAIVVTIPVLAAAATGCGASKQTAAPSTAVTGTTAAATTAPAPTTSTSSSAAGALVAEAQAAASGDIPDNQVFLVVRTVHYSIRYPEGWLQRTIGNTVTFRDKNNQMRIVTEAGPAFSRTSVGADLAAVKSANPSFRSSTPTAVVLPAGRGLKVVYSTKGPPDPVTNKRVSLTVDRYYISKGGRRAIVDLGGPTGVDNVDAFRLIIQSFQWR